MDVQLLFSGKERQCFKPGVECRGLVEKLLGLHTAVSLGQILMDRTFNSPTSMELSESSSVS